MQGTIKTLFENEFGLDLEKMPVNSPIYVGEANIGIKAFDESKNMQTFAKILYAVKKDKQQMYEIKLKNREMPEQPMASNHFIGIYKHYSGKVDYTFVKDLQENMEIISSNSIEKVEYIKKLKKDFVYDVTTETGNYYTNGLLSHNSPMSHLPSCITLDTDFKSSEKDEPTFSLRDIIKRTNIRYDETSIGVPFDISKFNIETLSFNAETQKIETKKITQLIYQGKKPTYKITAEKHSIYDPLHLTQDHPIWDSLKRSYIKTSEFIGESLFIDNNNTKLKIEQTDKVEHVFDIEVEDNHNFFANGILVKNCTGGEAPQFYSSTVNRVTKIDVIKLGNETIGQQIRVRNYKNKTSIPFRDAVVNLYYKGGFKPEEEYLDFFISFGLFKQGGAWYTHPEYGKFNGRAKIQEWLAEHPAEFELMRKEVDSLLCKETDLDKNNADPEKEPDEEFSITENDLEEEI